MWYGIVRVVMKLRQTLHLENKVQNSGSDKPIAGIKSKLRSLEKLEIWFSEGSKIGALSNFIIAPTTEVWLTFILIGKELR